MLEAFFTDFLKRIHNVHWVLIAIGTFSMIWSMIWPNEFAWAFGVGLFVGIFTYHAIGAFFKMLFKYMRHRAQVYAATHPPDFIIGEPENPYMLRWWWLPRNRFFNIYLHKMLKDDDDRALHDHPWPSLSHMVSGEIIEHYQVAVAGVGAYTETRKLTAGQWVWRGAKFAHRLAVPPQDDIPMTIFITGPRVRDWGFHCPKGWRHWQDFVSSEGKGQVGRGCGEMDQEPKGEY